MPRRDLPQATPQQQRALQVEFDHEPDDTGRGRPTGRVWQVLLRRGKRYAVIAAGLGRPSAEHLAHQVREVIEPAAIDTAHETR